MTNGEADQYFRLFWDIPSEEMAGRKEREDCITGNQTNGSWKWANRWSRRAKAGCPDSTKFLKMCRITTHVCNIKLTYAAVKGKVRDPEASLSGLFSTEMEL